MAELHIVGSIDSGHGFSEAAGLSDLFLKWTLESGPNFRVVQGLSTGQTVSAPATSFHLRLNHLHHLHRLHLSHISPPTLQH